MANTLGVYKPIFYAQEALAHLQKTLGMANRVHRGFDEERGTFGKGDTISIRRPSKFAVQAAPGTADDITTETVNILLDQWQTVKFKLTDKEMAYTGERIIRDHIEPAAFALANDIDNAGVALTDTIGPMYEQAAAGSGNVVVADLLQTRSRLFDNGVPMGDGRISFMIDGAAEATLLGIQQFSQFQGAGLEGVATQRTGMLGPKYGMDFFANQNAGATYTSGTVVQGADQLGAVNNGAGYAVGTTSIVVDAFTTTETFAIGDEITFAGHKAHYTVAAPLTLAAGAGTLVLKEGLIEPVIDDEVITAGALASNGLTALPCFHRNWAALAFARLPDYDGEFKDANISSVQDPITGLALRARMYYVGGSSEVEVALDVLYGWKELNSMFAAKLLF